MSGARFAVENYRLIDRERGGELLTGPALELTHFAHALNVDPPSDPASLVEAIEELIANTRRCSFATGDVLRRARREAVASVPAKAS